MAASRTGMAGTLIFLHIGKTAGTTFAEILDRNYPRKLRADIYPGFGLTEAEFAALPVARRAALRCVRGHFDYGIHRHLPGPFEYVTFLRSPVQQIRSRYNHIRQSRWHPLHRMVRQGMSLEEFVRRSPDNYQLRTLVGFELRHGGGHPALTRDHLAEVEENIETCFAPVGLTERFDESLLCLRRHLDLRTIAYRPRNVRRSGAARPLSPVELEVLEESTLLDRELYDWAAARLDRSIRQHGSDFDEELRRFRDEQARRGGRGSLGDAVAVRAKRLDRAGRTLWNALRRRFGRPGA